MRTLLNLLSVVGINAVLIWGLGFDGWSGPTALAIYWIENLVGSVLIALRILIHRRVTRKRGHFRAQLGVRVNEQELKSFLAEFTTASLAFTAAHGIFLGDQSPDEASVDRCLLGIGTRSHSRLDDGLAGLRSALWPSASLDA